MLEETISMLDDSLDFYENEPDHCLNCADCFIPYRTSAVEGVGDIFCSERCFHQWNNDLELVE